MSTVTGVKAKAYVYPDYQSIAHLLQAFIDYLWECINTPLFVSYFI